MQTPKSKYVPQPPMPTPPPQSVYGHVEPVFPRMILDRVEKLEKKVAELEQRLARTENPHNILP